MPAPVRYTDDLETIDSDEAATVRSLLDSFDHILRTTARDYGHAVRSVHAKAHAVLQGTLQVHEGLPAELRQGLFATPGTHPAWLRVSTNPGDLLSDKISLPRGIALKVEEARGPRLDGAIGQAQDFLMIDGPAFAVATAHDFARQLKLLAATTDRAEGGKVLLSKILQTVNAALGRVGAESASLAGIGGAPQVHPLGQTYFSATPFRYGDHVAKFRLRPLSADLTELTGKKIDTSDGDSPIRAHVRASMAGFDAEWAFEVQLARDLVCQPIEDASQIWDEDEAPFAQVATLRVPRQDSLDPAQVDQVDLGMRFSPWNGLQAHRPLGGVNRARRLPYEQSAQFRARFNRCPIHDLDMAE
ncbi:catalase family protein [Paracoccus shanxieyensis]|uniref:Catalase n=1 Tax=Paracoccus shanxieyensis TaxID=2675752 RepID=A0A6L6IY49_9RHOB|nr:catalase family protein [Paracoccus shanxieyensis]MTH63990.1 catalase [Paracoccus shanxieyensis]MTH86969.1 catalase [Paracoccus shanxieyensis]